MQVLSAWIAACGLVASCLMGCQTPTITVRHALPAAAPLPGDVTRLRAGGCTIAGGPKGDYAAMAGESLQQRLAATFPASQAGPAGEGDVTAAIHIELKDVRGKRVIRRWDAKTRTLVDREVPTLVRIASVRATFKMTRAGSGDPLGAVQTRAAYTSVEDARVRGELGLGRADDPEHVPPVREILREMITRCVRTFCGMVAPVVVTAEVRLRPVGSKEGAAGLSAAAAEQWDKAIIDFQAALLRNPEDMNARFDLAAVHEAAGHLGSALAGYEAVAKHGAGKDAEAAEAALRVTRVRSKLGQ